MPSFLSAAQNALLGFLDSGKHLAAVVLGHSALDHGRADPHADHPESFNANGGRSRTHEPRELDQGRGESLVDAAGGGVFLWQHYDGSRWIDEPIVLDPPCSLKREGWPRPAPASAQGG